MRWPWQPPCRPHNAPTIRITLAKAYCIPSRTLIDQVLPKYGVWFDAPHQDQRHGFDPLTGWPLYQTATITVKRAQAEWAEYLLLSMRRHDGRHVFQLKSKPQNAKNKDWARARKGLPQPWQLTDNMTPWQEQGCVSVGNMADGYLDMTYTRQERTQRKRKPRPQRRRFVRRSTLRR